MPWIDVARGICLIMVVLGHALIGAANAGLMHIGPAAAWMIAFVYSFDIPALFFISGLVGKDWRLPPDVFLRQTIAWIIWPYLLWSVTLLAMQSLAAGGRLVVADVGWDLIADPPLLMWFLYVLAVVKAVDYLASRVLDDRAVAYGMIVIGAIATLAFAFYPGDAGIVRRIFAALPFYGAGRALKPWIDMISDMPRPALVAGGVGALLGLIAGIVVAQGLSYQDILIITGSLGTLAVCAMAISWPGRLSQPLTIIGRYAMAIYVQHVIYAAIVRLALIKAWHDAPPALVVSAMLLAGLALPIAWQRVADRLGVTHLFGIRAVRPQERIRTARA